MSRKQPSTNLDLNRQYPRRSSQFSVYDLAPRSQPTEPAEDVSSFIARIGGPPSQPQPPPKRLVPVRTVVPKESSDGGATVRSLEKALEQERQVSDSLRKRVVELEIAVGKFHIAPPTRAPALPLPLPVPSNSSEWRLKLEEVQKRQLERMVGRGYDITI